jgi:hypothetical protein
VDSNQNNETGKPAMDDIAPNEQNISADTPPPASLENQSPLPQTTPPQIQPPMEVHHHAHTARKKWTHYLWEFLMLFLAVFCGFLAEYQLEHKIENQREKKYMRSMIADLKDDTARISKTINLNIGRFNGMDTLIQLLGAENFTPEDETRAYSFYSDAVSINGFSINDRTMRQLLNSGNMRLIRKERLSDSIMNYYGPRKELIEAQSEDISHFTYEANGFSQDIFDIANVRVDLNADTTLNYSLVPAKMKLLTHDKKVLQKYANKVGACRNLVGGYFQQLMKMKTRATHLLALIEKEYS